MVDMDDARRWWMINSVGAVRMEPNAKPMSVPLPLSSSILNLHGWTVTALNETPYTYTVEAEYDTPPKCPKCDSVAYQKFGTRDQGYHDLPVHMKRVAIMVHRQRYRCKVCDFVIWGSETREIAEARYDEWFKKLDPDIRPAFQELTGATGRWREYIFNYFDHRYTNAYTESVNGVVKAIQQAGRGYAFETIRAKMVYGLGPEVEEEIIPPDWW